jgi:hypothetical protein
LADTDYLHNLDEIVLYPNKDELIEKLRSVVPTDIFNKGMEGYSSGDRVTVSVGAIPKKNTPTPLPTTPLSEDEEAPATENPVHVNIPKPNATVAPTFNIPKAGGKSGSVPSFTPPGGSTVAMEAAAAYLQNKK